MAFYGRFMRTLCALGKPFVPLNTVPDLSELPDPVVFVARHRNLRGPIFALMHLPREVHPWVYSVFCDKKACFEQYNDFTFSVRMGLPNFLTRAMAWLLSRVVPRFVKSMGGIPVHRKSILLKKTFSQSITALKRGESLIIFPDVDYTSTDDAPGAIYSGFVMLGQLYKKATGENLLFVPLDIDMGRRALVVGNPVPFDDDRDFDEERKRAADALREEFAQLGARMTKPGKAAAKAGME